MTSACFEVFANALATESWRRSPPLTNESGVRTSPFSTFDCASRWSAGNATTISSMRVAGGQRREAQFEDRAAADLEELLRPIGAEAQAPATGGDDGGNMHVRVEELYR